LEKGTLGLRIAARARDCPEPLYRVISEHVVDTGVAELGAQEWQEWLCSKDPR
jgi:hypothetical protein